MMDHKDRLLHKRMAQAVTALTKLASVMQEHKPEWKMPLSVIMAVTDIKVLKEQIEKEGEKK